MSSLNQAFLLGNLVRDPDYSVTPGGKPVCKITLAVSNTYKDKDNKMVEDPLFIDIVLWNKSATNTATYMKKGGQAFIQGRLHLDKWTDKNEVKHYKIKVVASKIIFGAKSNVKPTTAADTPSSDLPKNTPGNNPPNQADNAQGEEDVPF